MKLLGAVMSLCLGTVSLFASIPKTLRLPHWGEVQDFSLIESSGKTISKKDLLGKVWIVDFIFTRCEGPCPLLSAHMAQLQKKGDKDLQFVSISVDPDYDTPEILSHYAREYRTKPNWFFLTGSKEGILSLLNKSFHVVREGEGIHLTHSTLFALVDSQGQIRGVYDGTNESSHQWILRDAKILQLEQCAPWTLQLPAFNALCNATSALFLISGFYFIRRKMVLQHKICMLSAFSISILFLISYLTYHHWMGSFPYPREGWIRNLYFSLLSSHTFLAAGIVPLAILTIRRAWRNDFQKHVQIARWTLPLWLYVALSGLTVYRMLYG